MPEPVEPGQEPEPTPGAEPPADPTPGEPGELTLEDAKAALAAARKEAAAYRVRAKEAEGKLTAAAGETEAKLKEATDKLAAAESRVKDSLIASSVMAEAARMGFADPSDAVALLPAGAVTVGDGEKVEGVAEALKALAKAKPHLLRGRGEGDSRDKGTPPKATDMNDALRKAAGRVPN